MPRSARASARALAFVLAAAIVPLAAESLISVNDEIALGRQAQRDVKAKTPEVRDAGIAGYVRSIGAALVRQTSGPKYPYSISIANYREINAFALPGGPVWIHRGTLAAAKNEAQVAGVLAHEIAHIARRHAADQLTKNLVANGLLGLLGAMLGNDRSARTAQAAAQALAGGYMLKFSRDDEREADRVGAHLMRRAGWDPREMVAFMDTLRRKQGRDPGSVEIFLSSHPAPAERAELLRAELRKTGASASARSVGRIGDAARFRAMQARLRRLPPASSLTASKRPR